MDLNFADDLYKFRQKTGMSQKEFAEKVGVSQAAINMWENGKRSPQLQHVFKIVDSFNISLIDLIPEMTRLKKFLEEEEYEDFIKPHNETSEEKCLLVDYHKLNDTGKKEARKRVQELTEIPKYTTPDQPPNQDK